MTNFNRISTPLQTSDKFIHILGYTAQSSNVELERYRSVQNSFVFSQGMYTFAFFPQRCSERTLSVVTRRDSHNATVCKSRRSCKYCEIRSIIYLQNKGFDATRTGPHKFAV